MAAPSQRAAVRRTNRRYRASEKSLATCFVISFPDLPDDQQDAQLDRASALLQTVPLNVVEYMTWGHEVGETDGIKHLQCYAYFREAQVFEELKYKHDAFEHARFIVATGSPLTNKIYCGKGPHCSSQATRREGVNALDYGKQARVYERGELPMGNERATLEYAAHLIRQGDKVSSLYHNPRFQDVIVKYGSHLSKMQAAIAEPRSSAKPSKTYFFSGDTGTGKTRAAVEFCKAFAGAENLCITGPSENGKATWCGNFESGMRCLVFNDIWPDSFPLNYLLTFIDPHYAHVVNVKYGMPTFSPDYIFFTSPFAMDELFANLPATQDQNLVQFYRRIHAQMKFGHAENEWDFESAVKHLCKIEKVDVNKVDFTDYTPDKSGYTTDGLRPNATNVIQKPGTAQTNNRAPAGKVTTVDLVDIPDDIDFHDQLAVILPDSASPALKAAAADAQNARFEEWIAGELEKLSI